MTTVAAPGPAHLTHGETLVIVAGVLVMVFLNSLDQTMVAGALPSIGREFGGTGSLSWLVTAYLTAVAATTPLYGKLSDLHGRRTIILVALGLYLAGSIACACAPNLTLLIAGRALQGLGGGGLASSAMAVLGDIAAPKERARYYSYYAIAYTSAGAGGPPLGGWLSERFHWSTIFWLDAALAVLALGLALTCLDRLPRHERPHRLDMIGAVLIVATTLAVLLLLNRVGLHASGTELLLEAAATIGLGAVLIRRLLTAPEPLIPLAVLGNRTVGQAIAMHAFGWGAILGLNVYLPLYLQTVMKLTPSHAGLSLIVLMTVLNISAALAAALVGRMTNYKLAPILGLAVTVAGVLAMAAFAATLTPLWLQVLLVAVGLGFGGVGALSSALLQNAVAPHQFGTASGLMNFMRVIMSAVMVAVFGALLAGSTGAGVDPATGFAWMFVVGAASMAVSLAMMLVVEAKPLRSGHA